MSSLKSTDLRNLTRDELIVKLASLKTDLFNLRFQAEAGRIEKPHRIRLLRRDLARINTILREGELKDAGKTKQA